MRFLVTAGSTREKIDRVRDWGNIFTGNTGYAIARELSELGQVDLITSNRAHLEEFRNKSRMNGAAFTSHADLKTAIGNAIQKHQYDAAFMTAAIADYRPAGSFQVIRRDVQSDGTETWTVRDVQAGKVKSSYEQVAFLGSAHGEAGRFVSHDLGVSWPAVQVQARGGCLCGEVDRNRPGQPTLKWGGLSGGQYVGDGGGGVCRCVFVERGGA